AGCQNLHVERNHVRDHHIRAVGRPRFLAERLVGLPRQRTGDVATGEHPPGGHRYLLGAVERQNRVWCRAHRVEAPAAIRVVDGLGGRDGPQELWGSTGQRRRRRLGREEIAVRDEEFLAHVERIERQRRGGATRFQNLVVRDGEIPGGLEEERHLGPGREV